MVISSLKGPNEVFSVPVRWLPERWHFEHYADLWTDTGMATWLRNTIILSTVVTFLQVLTGSFAAYGFAKVRFPGRDVLFLVYLGTIAVPWQSYMIPQYIMLAQAKLTNTLLVDHRAAGLRGIRRLPHEAVLRDDPRRAQRGRAARRAQRVLDLGSHHAAALGSRTRQHSRC